MQDLRRSAEKLASVGSRQGSRMPNPTGDFFSARTKMYLYLSGIGLSHG